MPTIREVFETHYVPNHPQLKPRTLERYRLEILRWERNTTNPPVSKVTTEVFNRFRKTCLDHGLRATTIEAGIRTILQVLRLAGPETERRQGLGLIARVPFVGHPLRAVFRQQPVPTVDALRRLCRLPCFVRRELSRICVAAQIDRITPHAIRRASVTEWSIVDRDCGQLIHGEGLGIRDLYANPERLLRAKIDKFPDLSKR